MLLKNENITLSQQAIYSVNNGQLSFCKFLSANDTGFTGGHQSGIYVPKIAAKLLFKEPGQKGTNIKRVVKIKWQNDFETESTFTYYGTGTRNEYRITRFGRGFDLLKPDNTGALFVFVQKNIDYYEGWVLEEEDYINEFLNFFGMSPSDTGKLISKVPIIENQESQLLEEMDKFIFSLKNGFPKAYEMSAAARKIYNLIYNHIENIINKPDQELLNWNKTEYLLFQRIEENQYGDTIRRGFSSMQEFIDVANSVLNRRKSRAGKSLEFHLEAIFKGNNLCFETQVITEERKRPDFIFPSGNAYHDKFYPTDKLIVLGAKTTCKDRWRQIITEANRVDVKYLCTLQQGISPQQLHEMKSERVVLVVPQPYIQTYPKEYRKDILSLANFIKLVKEKTLYF